MIKKVISILLLITFLYTARVALFWWPSALLDSEVGIISVYYPEEVPNEEYVKWTLYEILILAIAAGSIIGAIALNKRWLKAMGIVLIVFGCYSIINYVGIMVTSGVPMIPLEGILAILIGFLLLVFQKKRQMPSQNV